MQEAVSQFTEEENTLVLVGPFEDALPEPDGGMGDIQVGVLRAGGAYTLIACEPAPAGARLFDMTGELTDIPSRYSVQVGKDTHLDLSPSIGHEEMMDSCFWRFMNHSCTPNARIDGQQVIALTGIQPGEEITFHYSTTEFAMAEPFDCWCGSENCAGRIAGFSAASDTERARLRPWLARHLLTAGPPASNGAPESAAGAAGP
ncbi:SET domain-containing protein-lysine N-methyltransferase [Streptomyces sp. NBC_00648]